MPATWTHKPAVLDYVVACYRGVEPPVGNRKARRVFEWTEDGEVVGGNTKAFVEHVVAHFALPVRADAAVIHQLLLDLGERAGEDHSHDRRGHGAYAGRWQEPVAEVWVVGLVADALPPLSNSDSST